ncbi:MAG TPA: DUF411 domain-containing protein [Gemmatimonadales bacterium]|jgi:hypothetical protein|nr:DUF411 domain-containing protein [Gemmatimonadales bacterium]
MSGLKSIVVGVVALAVAGTALAGQRAAQAKGPEMTVYKSPTCGCCGKWIDHIKAAGFTVKVVDLDDLTEIKQASAVPMKLRTCHTALVDNYVIEGHVPADVVKKLLAEKPAAIGIAVPGMPIGSPGMEVGNQKDAYEVILFEKGGKTSVYAKR